MLVENTFGTGLVNRPDSPKDYIFGSNEEFDWDKGYDVEEDLRQTMGAYTYRLKPNNQLQSQACVGEAWSKYAEVLFAKYKKREAKFSPRWIYSQIALKGGGANIFDGGNLVCKKGVVLDEVMPSDPATEENMTDKKILEDGKGTDFNSAMSELVKGGKVFNVFNNIDSLAKGIRDNQGVVFGVGGCNNGTWYTVFPKPPNSVSEAQWGHALYAGKARIRNGKKYIGVLNSWGNIGEAGWQWLGEDYINPTFSFTGWVWNPEVGNIKDRQLYEQIDKYVLDNKINWGYDSEWLKIKQHFNTNLSRAMYWDYLVIKKYLTLNQ